MGRNICPAGGSIMANLDSDCAVHAVILGVALVDCPMTEQDKGMMAIILTGFVVFIIMMILMFIKIYTEEETDQ